MRNKIFSAIGMIAIAAAARSACASTITDGNFEQGLTGTGASTSFAAWYLENGSNANPSAQAVANASSPYDGSYSAQLSGTLTTAGGVELVQNSVPSVTTFSTSFVVASTNAGGSGARDFQLLIGDRAATNGSGTNNDLVNDTKINLIVNVNASNTATGDVEVNTGSSFVTPTGLTGSFTFSSSLSSPTWNTISVQGVLDGTADSYYTVTVNGTTSSAITGFQKGAQESNTIPTDFGRIGFSTLSSGSSFIVDDVVVTPEPASLGLLGLGALGLLGRRRASHRAIA